MKTVVVVVVVVVVVILIYETLILKVFRTIFFSPAYAELRKYHQVSVFVC